VPEPESATGDFDFAAALGKFDKKKEMELLAAPSGGVAAPRAPTAYSKASFFDSFTTESQMGGRLRRDEEKRLNSETFGAAGLAETNNNRRWRGRRGGGGGGGGGGVPGRRHCV
jgi:protein LSM14